MAKILVCQHVGYEPLGTLNPLLKEHGFRLRYVNFARFPETKPSPIGYDALIVLGGPMSTYQKQDFPHLRHEIRMIELALKQDIPILGICLGAQLIAEALGAKVRANTVKEIGWYPIQLSDEAKQDPVFQFFRNPEWVFQWHGDTFDLPEGACHLASTSSCFQQAFRYGSKVYGLQFHLEVDEPMVHRWFQVPHHCREVESLKTYIDPQKILQETPSRMERLQELSREAFGAFLGLLGGEKKFIRLPSR